METLGNDLVTLIGSLGFPIVACIYMAYVHNQSEVRHSNERVKMTEALTEMNTLLKHINDLLMKDKG